MLKHRFIRVYVPFLKYILIFLFWGTSFLYAKKEYIPYVGTQAWTNIELSYKFNKQFSIDYENEERFELDYEKKTKLLNTFGIGYKPLEFLSIDGLVRVRHTNRIPSMEYLIQSSLKTNLNDFYFKYRIRFQYKMKDFERILRNKFEVGYNITDNLSLAINSESFLSLYSINFSEFNQMRHSVNISYDLSKIVEVTTGFIYETEFNIKKPKDARIYTLGLGISL